MVGDHLLQGQSSGRTEHTHVEGATSFLTVITFPYQNQEEKPLRKVQKVQKHHLLGLTLTLLPQAEGMKAEPFENHSALEIAEQLTLLDHLVFKKIPYE